MEVVNISEAKDRRILDDINEIEQSLMGAEGIISVCMAAVYDGAMYKVGCDGDKVHDALYVALGLVREADKRFNVMTVRGDNLGSKP